MNKKTNNLIFIYWELVGHDIRGIYNQVVHPAQSLVTTGHKLMCIHKQISERNYVLSHSIPNDHQQTQTGTRNGIPDTIF